MNDTRRLIEQVGEGAPFPSDAFERMLRRRDRKRRNQRLVAASVGIAVFVAAIVVLLSGNPFDRSTLPAGPTPTGSAALIGNGEITVSTYPGNGEGLQAIDPAGGPAHLLVACSGVCYDIGSGDWSPDGTRLAYNQSSYETPGLNGIYVLDVRTGEASRLTHCADGCPSGQGGIAWSPDGSMIAFSGNGLFVMNADGSSQRRLPTGPVAEPGGISWSPDGSHIAFSGHEGNDFHVYTMDLDGSQLTPLTDGSMYECCNSPSWSPDGAKILYFVTPKSGKRWGAQVWVMSADGSDKTLLADFACCQDVYGGRWSPDGTKIAFVIITDPEEAPHLYVMNADGSDLTRVAESWGRPAWQPILLSAGG
jgi:Tol biopolymer transport system component